MCVCVCMHMCVVCEEYSLIYILFLRFYVYIIVGLVRCSVLTLSVGELLC